MKPVRALLWKEGREAAYKIGAGSCVALLLGVTYLHPVFNKEYPLEAVSFLVGLLASVLMGIDQVAGERSRGTLPFLLSRPLAPARMLGVKFAVGAAGVLAVLAAFWAGVFLGLPEWGKPNFLWWFYQDPSQDFSRYSWLQEILQDVGFARILLVWFFLWLIPYTLVFLSSSFTDRPLKAIAIALMAGWVSLFCLGTSSQLSPAVSYFSQRILFTDLTDEILRLAFDPSLLLAKLAAAALIAGGALLWSTLTLRAQPGRRFQWGVTTLALISGAIVLAMDATQPHRTDAPVEPVGSLPFEATVADLALLKDRFAVVLLGNGVSVVDVVDPQAPKETGQAQIDGWRLWRLALSGTTAYAWGSAKDSVGVAVFDLDRPENPRLAGKRLLHPIESGPTPWLKRTPRLTGWAVREGYLYAGLLGSELLELHSFDVREGELPQPVHVLPVEERIRHAWSYDGEMQFAGAYAFLTVGHDFVVLDLTDSGLPAELNRTPLRRFGRSRQYEESIEQLYHQLSPGVLPESVVQKLEKAGHRMESLEMPELTPDGDLFYRIARPPALGPISVVGNRVYVQRHWPQELAVLDISDPRQPVEFDYILGKFPPLTMDGDFAYGMAWDGIWSYAETWYGAMPRRERLAFPDEKAIANLPPGLLDVMGEFNYQSIGTGGQRLIRVLDYLPPNYIPPFNYRGHHNLILAGDHIWAVIKNHLVVFETLQND